ncbi:MAG: hypothetical protein P8J82_12970 [Tateyamaria sp.]|nr:hypothetical protein [Tateyamaria sp.]
MMSNNTILTVSYGTFSCTLEGFDDSFGTMKVIAEYFRNLAAHDRYFGAEPPQPDAEVLARIAEREISRPVEARETDGRIVLSTDAVHASLNDASPTAVASASAAPPPLTTSTVTEAPLVNEPPIVKGQLIIAELSNAEAVTKDLSSEPDSIAEKLQRIRAVVSKSQDEATEDDLFEDEYSENLAPSLDTPLLLTKTFTDEDATQIGETQEISKEAPLEDDTNDSAIRAHFDTKAKVETDKDAAQIAQSNIQDATNDGTDKQHNTQAPLTVDNTQADTQTKEGRTDIAGIDNNALAENKQETRASKPRARIVKVKRADIDAALDKGALEEIKEIDETPQPSTLSEVDEAELLAELAEVEAEFPNDSAQLMQQNVLEAPNKEIAVAPPVDDDLSRLLAEVDNQMGEPEGVRRRNAFAHLKAAVMAKKADTGSNTKKETDGALDQDDLEAVINPRYVEKRPDRPRPAPLRLVAEQRVDNLANRSPDASDSYRIEATLNETVEIHADVCFEDFAIEMGAHELLDLVEAAASYICYVRGQEAFWRRKVMRLVSEVEKESFSREDTLRCFGELIRNGKIKRNEDGRYGVSNTIGYHPEERAAG